MDIGYGYLSRAWRKCGEKVGWIRITRLIPCDLLWYLRLNVLGLLFVAAAQ